MSFCTKCGSKLDEGVEVCPWCGASQGREPVANGAPRQEQSQPQQSTTSRTRILLVGIAATLVVVVAILVVVGTTNGGGGAMPPKPPLEGSTVNQTNTNDAEAEEWAKKEAEAAAAAKKEAEERAKKEASTKAIADAYTNVLDRVGPTFPREDWWGPVELEYKYFIAELNGDDIPELVVSLSTNPSDEYYYFFVYDPNTKTANLVQSEGVRNYHFRESWTYDPNMHALICAGIYGGQSVFAKVYIANDQVVQESIDEASVPGHTGADKIVAYDLSNRSAIDSLAQGVS